MKKRLPIGYDHHMHIHVDIISTIMESYANGVEFNTLLKDNPEIKRLHTQVKRKKKEASDILEKVILRLAKEAAEKEKKQEAMAKLSSEELEAFGLVKHRKSHYD
jgi:hemoglobin-like flavoprotein